MLLALSGTLAKYILKSVIMQNSQRSCEKCVKLDVYGDGKPALTLLSGVECDHVWVCNDVYSHTHRYPHMIRRQNLCGIAWVHIFVFALSHVQQRGD